MYFIIECNNYVLAVFGSYMAVFGTDLFGWIGVQKSFFISCLIAKSTFVGYKVFVTKTSKIGN